MPKLHPHIGVPATQRRVLSTLATIAVLLVVEGLFVFPYLRDSFLEHANNGLSDGHGKAAPAILSTADIVHYRDAFTLQKAGHIEGADAAVSQVNDPLLKGVLLGERYLTPGNNPSFSEIALWLERYGDHAQAGELYHMARAQAPDDANFLTEPAISASLKGFSNGNDRSELSDQKHWVSGLAAFRRHDPATAAAHFKALLLTEGEYLSYDDRAAVAYWAYRSTLTAGDAPGALKYIEAAAEEPPCFYSIIARQILGERSVKAGDVQKADIASFLEKVAVRRAIALKAVGQDALAEKEIRSLFPSSDAGDRKHLVQLARMLNLPAAQMRMAVAGSYDATSADARFPLPHWAPTSGYRLEPALLFAIMRQESGFNPNAKSASGAIGVMQLMPATAHAMAVDARMKLSPEPEVSMTLGQHYIERLMNIPAISDNLVYIIASYNAGPGSVIAWQKSVRANNDPLLFIESLPSLQARDYVVHVMGNYWVYSALLGGVDNESVTALAGNRWPLYARESKQMVSMVSHLNDVAGAE